jgi:hypothetical protein
VDIAVPEVLVGGLIGTMIIFYFTGESDTIVLPRVVMCAS